ncbi:hypothetical protein PTSG_12140 [Salpingoeca rosetta]|uniref:Ribosomal eL28/Mak16 domain-containing protein n=1 Tax=Salpingoeca rosetta (strain ATCC 50818 / BSB-021) TaxID=946362 RepID=F2U6U2_SALR5|nr:uncharacterized protein PTSG_12140 [Salpingoeca rosetta]EGD83574.1 hypothetical protein PTSG_12140 [Salpingoeca rosetta]|eukprot:XP_004995078.1 hypothetical protein PTSG_12140 [Salpingoeca rosetta]
MSSALQWKIVRKFNKFQHVNSSGDGRVFSKEPTNLKNINSPRFSGIVNAKAIGLKAGPKGGAIVITKTKKAAVCPKKGFQGVALRRGARPTNRAVANVARCLRPDLKRAAVARASALILASKPKSGSKKSRSGRKSRKSRNEAKNAEVCEKLVNLATAAKRYESKQEMAKLQRLQAQTQQVFHDTQASVPPWFTMPKPTVGAEVQSLPIDAAWHGFATHMSSACVTAMELFCRDRRQHDAPTAQFLERMRHHTSRRAAAAAAAAAARHAPQYQRSHPQAQAHPQTHLRPRPHPHRHVCAPAPAQQPQIQTQPQPHVRRAVYQRDNAGISSVQQPHGQAYPQTQPFQTNLELPPGDYDVVFSDRDTGQKQAYRLIMGPNERTTLALSRPR